MGMMGIWLIVFLVVLFLAAMIGTLFALKQEEKKMKRYEEKGESASDELQRSHEYEHKSLKSDLPLQVAIYSVTIVLSVIAFVWFAL